MSTTTNETISDRLRQAREAAGLSQGQVAKKLSMHRPTISEIEAGRRKVSADEIAAFATVYGIPIDWIIRGADADQPDDARILVAARELSKMSEPDLARLLKMLQMLRKTG